MTQALTKHIRTHWRALDRLEAHGDAFPHRTLKLLATPERRHVAERIAAALHEIPVAHSDLTHDYYDGLRFMIDVTTPGGSNMPVIDGGTFGWLRKLTANAKLAFVASGMGSQLIAFAFRRPA